MIAYTVRCGCISGILLLDSLRPPRSETRLRARTEIVRRLGDAQLNLQRPDQAMDGLPPGLPVLRHAAEARSILISRVQPLLRLPNHLVWHGFPYVSRRRSER